MRWYRESIGLGGRLRVYRFSAPVTDLHAHAQAEFAARKLALKAIPDVKLPITNPGITLHSSGLESDLDWMFAPAGAIGVHYESADGQWSHRPVIFVDETNGVLYFRMTD